MVQLWSDLQTCVESISYLYLFMKTCFYVAVGPVRWRFDEQIRRKLCLYRWLYFLYAFDSCLLCNLAASQVYLRRQQKQLNLTELSWTELSWAELNWTELNSFSKTIKASASRSDWATDVNKTKMQTRRRCRKIIKRELLRPNKSFQDSLFPSCFASWLCGPLDMHQSVGPAHKSQCSP